MLIERDKNYRLNLAIVIFLLVTLLLLYIYGCNLSISLALLINSPVYIIVALGFISSGRTFIMSEDGCTVCFWKYQKDYTWEELKTKRIEAHNLPSMLDGRNSCPYLKEAIFSPYRIRKPRIIRAATYSLLHPLSCIYVNFSLENKDYQIGRYYEIEEASFRKKMDQWGITLDEK